MERWARQKEAERKQEAGFHCGSEDDKSLVEFGTLQWGGWRCDDSCTFHGPWPDLWFLWFLWLLLSPPPSFQYHLAFKPFLLLALLPAALLFLGAAVLQTWALILMFHPSCFFSSLSPLSRLLLFDSDHNIILVSVLLENLVNSLQQRYRDDWTVYKRAWTPFIRQKEMCWQNVWLTYLCKPSHTCQYTKTQISMHLFVTVQCLSCFNIIKIYIGLLCRQNKYFKNVTSGPRTYILTFYESHNRERSD